MWRRKRQSIPVFLLEESHGQTSLEGCSPWRHRVEHNWSDVALVLSMRLFRTTDSNTHALTLLSPPPNPHQLSHTYFSLAVTVPPKRGALCKREASVAGRAASGWDHLQDFLGLCDPRIPSLASCLTSLSFFLSFWPSCTPYGTSVPDQGMNLGHGSESPES